MLAVFGFAGLSLRYDGLTIDPRLPEGWRNLTFRIQWRRRSLRISIDPDKQIVEAIVEAGEPMVLFVGGEPNQINSAATVVIQSEPRNEQER